MMDDNGLGSFIRLALLFQPFLISQVTSSVVECKIGVMQECCKTDIWYGKAMKIIC